MREMHIFNVFIYCNAHTKQCKDCQLYSNTKYTHAYTNTPPPLRHKGDGDKVCLYVYLHFNVCVQSLR